MRILLLLVLPVVVLCQLSPQTTVPCGTPVVQPITKRIVGGKEAAQGSWPWMVMIVALTNDLRLIVEGSGSILGTHVILTTAQHFEGPGFSVFDLDLRHWQLHLGNHHMNTRDPNQRLYLIRKVILHPGYNVTSLKDDIALIITQEPIEYNDHTRPACLPDASHHYRVGDVCYLPGWGSTLTTGDDEVLNQVDMPILDDSVCSRQFRDFLSDTEICAGYETGIKEFCPSDLGSPLMCKDSNGIWYIQGLASSGVDCHITRYPGVYEDLSMYSDWIKQTMATSGYPYEY
uniref:Serine protease n=1 Tax=Sinohyriopsis cumingii TaxID=165450 RepID=D2KKK2_SINCU|nr:serine protease [Sinohyriopsis cumingii]